MVPRPAGPAGGPRRRPRPRRFAARSVTQSAGCACATASGRGMRTGRSSPAPLWRLAAASRGSAPAPRRCGLQWWENPGVVPGIVTGFSAPSAAATALRKLQAQADVPPPAPHAKQAEATHARLPGSWVPASWRQVFARAGPGPSTGPPGCAGLPTAVMSDGRGQSMAGPAVLIRADRKSRARSGTAHAFGSSDPPVFLPRYA